MLVIAIAMYSAEPNLTVVLTGYETTVTRIELEDGDECSSPEFTVTVTVAGDEGQIKGCTCSYQSRKGQNSNLLGFLHLVGKGIKPTNFGIITLWRYFTRCISLWMLVEAS